MYATALYMPVVNDDRKNDIVELSCMLFALQPVPLVGPEKFDARTVVETMAEAISDIATVATTTSPNFSVRLNCCVYIDAILTTLIHPRALRSKDIPFIALLEGQDMGTKSR